ncbi:MAG: kinase-like domain-containing protein [Benniella sp.]|nr:MAG: kinase-like domain-containing protein [Benniella sp.]
MSQLSTVDSVSGARERIGDLLYDRTKQISYQILDVLGYGTYGSIFLAKTVSSMPGFIPEYKAIKCLSKKGLTPNQLLLQRQEIDIHLSLSSPTNGYHPHIVDMSSVIETKDSLYLVMEYCAGGDLYDAITSQHAGVRDPALDYGRALDCHSDASVLDAMAQIISALAHAHAHQVFHRDLKPENVLVASDGSLKLADFGLATKERVSNDFGCGSSFYMAPEQQPSSTSRSTTTTLGGRRPYLPSKSDVWSLGIIFLNLRFGRNPWKLSRVDLDPTFAAYTQDPNVLREMFPELSSSALYFLKRVLCVDPTERADCYEALDLIKRVDRIVGDDFAAMENCDDERLYSNMASSVGSSSDDESEEDSEDDDEDDDNEDDDEYEDEDEEYIDSMFLMENDLDACPPTAKNNADRTSCSSEWSMASSYQSGKSWSDMLDEEEMDFSLPVEFDEACPATTSTVEDNVASDNVTTAPATAATTAPDVLVATKDNASPSLPNLNLDLATSDDDNTPNTHSDDLDDDYHHQHHHHHSFTLRCYDSNSNQHYQQETPSTLLAPLAQPQSSLQSHPSQLLSKNSKSSQPLHLSSSSSSWVTDDFCADFAGFSKLSPDPMFLSTNTTTTAAASHHRSGGFPSKSASAHSGAFFFGGRLLSIAP